jgi:peptide/nickel transport system permease protein
MIHPDREAETRVNPAPGVGGTADRPASGVWRLALGVFVTNRLAVVGVVIIVLMALFCFVGPLLYHTDQIHTNLMEANLPPGSGHPLGTTALGRDELGRLMVGGQTSLEIGVLVALVATGFGVVWGAVAGFVGGAVDSVMMRIVDIFLSIPSLFILIFLATVIRPTVLTLALVVSFIAWLGPARLVRGETLTLRVRDFVSAVQSMGGGRTRIVWRHIVPNTIGTIVVNATFQVADAILVVATLSFLGLGIPPPAANWGGMLSNGLTYIYDGYWWLIYPAGIAIVLTVVAFNFVGDALREALEVRLQRH